MVATRKGSKRSSSKKRPAAKRAGRSTARTKAARKSTRKSAARKTTRKSTARKTAKAKRTRGVAGVARQGLDTVKGGLGTVKGAGERALEVVKEVTTDVVQGVKEGWSRG